MALLKNHGETLVNQATQYSKMEKIKKEHGYLPFEGEGFIPGGKEYTDGAIKWTEIRPVYRVTFGGQLQLLGAVKYFVDKYEEYEGTWHPAHYHLKGLMTAGEYKKALKQDAEDRAKDYLSKRNDILDQASATERNNREKEVKKGLKLGKKLQEIDVQSLRDAEARARGRRLAEGLKQGRRSRGR